MAGTASTIGKAYVQILPSMEGIAGQMTSMLGGPAQEAGKAAGSEMGSAMGGSLSSGLMSALTGIGSKIADVMKTAISEVTSFVADSVKTGMGFDTAMSQVAATMGTTVDEIKDLREFAKEMGATTQYSATQSAEALNYMALAGYDVKTSMEMLPNVMNLAAAGAMDLARSSDMITDTQTALGLSIADTNKLVDQMAKTASRTNTSVEQLGDAMLTIGGTAKGLKGGTAELNQVLGIMADNGIKGTEAGTHLRNIMLAMNPTTDAALAAFKRLGLEAYDSEGNLRRMSDIFGDISKALDGVSNEERTRILQNMFNKTDLSTVNALIDTNAGRWKQVAAEIDKCDGAASAMAETQLDNLQGSVTILQSAFEGLQIAISDEVTPKLKEFVDFGANGLSRLTEAFQSGGINGLTEEFGKLAEELADKITEVLPDVTGVFVMLTNNLAGTFSKILPKLVDSIKAYVPKIVNALGAMFLNISDCLPGVIDIIAAALSEAIKLIPEFLPDIAEIITKTFGTLISGFTDILPILLETLTGVIEQIAQMIPEILPPLFEAIVNAIPAIVQTIADNLPVIIQALTDVVMAIAEVVPTILPALMPALTEGVKALISGLAAAMVVLPELASAVLDVVMAVADAVLDNLPVLLDSMVQIMAALGKSIYDNFPEIVDAFGKLFVKVVDAIEEWFPKLWNAGKELWSNIIGGIKDNWDSFMHEVYEWGDSVLEAVGGIWDDMKDFWGGLWDKMVDIGGDLIEGLIEGLKKKWEDLKADVADFCGFMIDDIKDRFGIASPSKVMRDEVGRYLAEGIGEGFTEELAGVSKSMSNSVGTILDDMGSVEMNANVTGLIGSGQMTVTAPTNTDDLAKTEPTVFQFVFPDSRTFAEFQIDDINALLGQTTTLQMGGFAT